MLTLVSTGLVLLLGCVAGGDDDGRLPATIQVEAADRRDSVRIETDAGGVIVVVSSPRGIGRARIIRAGGAWPETLRVRLDLRGLEGFMVRRGDEQLELSVTSRGQVFRGRRLVDAEGAVVDVEIAPGDPRWMPLEIRTLPPGGATTGEEAPPGGEASPGGLPPLRRYEIALPALLLATKRDDASADGGDVIELQWVDFYRR